MKEEGIGDGNLGLRTEMDGRNNVCGEHISLWSKSRSELSQ